MSPICVADFLVWARKGRFRCTGGRAREVGERKGMPEGKGKKGGRAAGGKVDGRRILRAEADNDNADHCPFAVVW